MAFRIVVAIGRRSAVGGPIVRMVGKFKEVPAGSNGVNLMITDCTLVRRITRLNLGATGEAEFSLSQLDLDQACQGLNPNADWYVYGQAGKPPQTSLGVKFPAGELGHDSESHDIPRLKRAAIARLKDKIRTNRLKVALLNRLAAEASAYAAKPNAIQWFSQKASELADEATDEMARLEEENDAAAREIERREAQLERDFGGR